MHAFARSFSLVRDENQREASAACEDKSPQILAVDHRDRHGIEIEIAQPS